MLIELFFGFVKYSEMVLFIEEIILVKLIFVYDIKLGVWGKFVVELGVFDYVIVGLLIEV